MAAAASFDVICIECGLFMHSVKDLQKHMESVHHEALPSSSPGKVNQPSASVKEDMEKDGGSSSSNNAAPMAAPVTSLLPPHVGELDGAACCRFLTELFALIKPSQQQQPAVYGDSPFTQIANAALTELLRKQQVISKPVVDNNKTAPTVEAATSSESSQDEPISLVKNSNSPPAPHSVMRTSADPVSPTSKRTQAVTSNKADRRYICEYCSKQFAQAPTLIAHRRIHTGEKPYKCHICNAAFKQVTHRNDHVNSHDPDYRPFICQECGRGFARKYSLSIHSLIHKGIYRFQCSYCDKKFRQSADKKKHELRHTRPAK